MMNYQKYSKGYFMPPEIDLEWAKKDAPDHAPIWCSVDLRDGNQSLVIPMSLDEKLEFYKMLLKVGFKEIEIGFPAASETEYEFLRRLVEEDLIPDDVTIQVLTQAREHIIRKTFDALKGVKNAIVHVYNSTSVAQRQQVFRKDKEQIKQMAVDGAKLLQELTADADDLVDGLHHMYGDADGTGLIGDGAGDGLTDPPCGVGGELVALGVVELFHGLDQT